MTPNSQVDDFIADDFVADEPTLKLGKAQVSQQRQPQDTQDDFIADDFIADQPEKPKVKSIGDYNWLEKHFTVEGQKALAKHNVNQLKATASGLTAGFSQVIPGFKVDESDQSLTGKIERGAAEVAGSVLPIGGAAKVIAWPLLKIASNAPKFVKPLNHLANILGISAAGGLYEGLEESAEKSIEKGEFVPPSPETILEQGGKWAALDIALRSLGWGGRFAKSLFTKSAELAEPVVELLSNVMREIKPGEKQVAEKAMQVLESMPAKASTEAIERASELGLPKPAQPQPTDLQVNALAQADMSNRVAAQEQALRNTKVEPQDWTKLENTTVVKPYLPGEFQATEIAEEAISKDLNQRIENVSQRAATEKQLGENIQADLEARIEAQTAETDALYAIAKAGEEGKYPKVQSTVDSVVRQLQQLEGKALKPEGYSRVETQLRNLITDLGYGLETDAAGRTIAAHQVTPRTLAETIDIKKRLNKIINYDLIDTGAQDLLKDPVANLRMNIREGYGPTDSKARKAFEQGEKKFGEFAEKKGVKNIAKMRQSETPETIAKMIKTPSGAEQVKQIVSPQQFSQIEREWLEHMRDMKYDKAAQFYREMRPSFSHETRPIAEELIASKAPKDSPIRKVAQRDAIQDKAIDDLAKATITGERPDVALKLWKTTEGQQLIKHALESNPNKEQVLKYLQDQSFKDFSSSVIEADGTIDFKKFNELLKDKATLENIRLVAGEEGVRFFKNLEALSNRAQKNNAILERSINKGSVSDREKIDKELRKVFDERIKTLKEKGKVLTPEEQVFVDNFDKEAAKVREEAKESLTKKGKSRFAVSKSRRAEELAAKEAKEKRTLINKADDLVRSYTTTAKGALTAFGMYTIGPVPGLLGAAGYETFMALAKNKKVRDAFIKAAIPQSSPAQYIKSVLNLEEELDDYLRR